MLRTLRSVENDLVLAIPWEFVDRNGLTDGSHVELHLVGKRMIVVDVPRRPRYKMADLVAEMPDGLPRAEGWEDVPPAGEEDDSTNAGSATRGLMRFAASKKNVDRVAMRLFVCVAAFGALVAIVTIAAMIAR